MWDFSLLVSIGLVIFGVVHLAYHNQHVWRRFHARRVHKYWGMTHAKRHHLNCGRHHTHEMFDDSFAVPGVLEVCRGDFRAPSGDSSSDSESAEPLRIVSWNIELGYKMDEIIGQLRSLDAQRPIDILLLQEVDCLDNGEDVKIDCAREIAKALHLTYAWGGAHSYPHRKGRGTWGVAILSRHILTHVAMIPIPEIVPGYCKSAMRAVVSHPRAGQILCYSVHLEACAGIADRVRQFSVVLKDWTEQCDAIKPKAAIIAGDLNTLGHGLARISPVHCRDHYRFKTLFERESAWWQRNLFSQPGQAGYGFSDPFDKSTKAHQTLINTMSQGKYDWILLNGLSSVHHEVGNQCHASDHWLVLCDAVVSPERPYVHAASCKRPLTPRALAQLI